MTCREVSPVGTMDIEHLATSTTIEGAHSAVGRRGKGEVHPRIPISELKPCYMRDCDITVTVTCFSYRRPSQVTPWWHNARHFHLPLSILYLSTHAFSTYTFFVFRCLRTGLRAIELSLHRRRELEPSARRRSRMPRKSSGWWKQGLVSTYFLSRPFSFSQLFSQELEGRSLMP